MFGRIRDAVQTLLHGGPSDSERRYRKLEADTRALTTELNDALEKLNAWAAREAKRSSRAAKRLLDEQQTEELQQVQQHDPRQLTLEPDPAHDRAEWKRQMWQRVGPQLRRSASGVPQ